jgi:hypothetical protein
MIDHPEDYAGPTEPCGDLSAAPFGGGEPQCKCPIGGPCADGGPHCFAQGIGGPGFTGNPPGLLQDDCAGMSKALASKPDARQHAREAAEAAVLRRAAESVRLFFPQRTPDRRAAEAAYIKTAFDYARAPVGSRDWVLFWQGWQAARLTPPPGGWSDSGPVEGA